MKRFRITSSIVVILAVAGLGSTAFAQGKETGNEIEKRKALEQKQKSRIKPLPPNVDPTATAGLKAKAIADATLPRVPGDFLISPIEGSPGLFNVTLYEKASRESVTAMYNLSQVTLIESIMSESLKFSRTDEEAGTTKPVTTRFFNHEEPSFFVDVSKIGKTSQYFVTMKSRQSHVTVDAGTIKRGQPDETTFFQTMLIKIQTAVSEQKKQLN